jgi:hypothetical protein
MKIQFTKTTIYSSNLVFCYHKYILNIEMAR